MTEIKEDAEGRKVIDKSKPDKPPRETPRQTRAKAKLPSPPSLETRLAEFFGKIETTEDGLTYLTGISGLAGIVDPRDGTLIAVHGPAMAKAWSELANESPRVKRALEWMLTGGAWGGVFIATSPVILGIMANHGLLRKDLLGMGSEQEENGQPVQDTSSEQPGTTPRNPAHPVE